MESKVPENFNSGFWQREKFATFVMSLHKVMRPRLMWLNLKSI